MRASKLRIPLSARLRSTAALGAGLMLLACLPLLSQTYTSPDLVEEVKIITATVDAENGRGSGQVQMATRSGTNAIKGSLFWTNRNSRFDANSWNNNLTGSPLDFENRNQFGGRIGGPIVKNRTFFFLNFEGRRDASSANATRTVPSDELRAGNLRYGNPPNRDVTV